MLTADRSFDALGSQLPKSLALAAQMLVMAANSNAISYLLLSSAAAHLIQAFGEPRLKAQFMAPMYEGRWTGTVALTEADASIQCTARAIERTTDLGQAVAELHGEEPDASLPWPHLITGGIDRVSMLGGLHHSYRPAA